MTWYHVLLHCPNERLSVGRKGPGRRARPPGQPQVGEEAAEVSRALRGRECSCRWTNEDEAWAQKMDD
jgi:hypothetical protein